MQMMVPMIVLVVILIKWSYNKTAIVPRSIIAALWFIVDAMILSQWEDFNPRSNEKYVEFNNVLNFLLIYVTSQVIFFNKRND